MQCLRCDSQMKHYKLEQKFDIYGSWHKTISIMAEQQIPHNPHSVYICDNCGYVEFSTKYCDNPDV